MNSTSVLIVGAGPVGLTAAAELCRRGVRCRIIDRQHTPPQYAKAVGIQPRTLEIWESMGLLKAALNAATELRGQMIFVNGREVARVELTVPADVPYGFVGLPQYETERILAEHLANLGTEVERGVELRAFAQDADGVTASLVAPGGEDTVRADFLVGCDGAHSVVRKGLGLSFIGDGFPEEYMLGDVEVDWSLPPGFGIRSLHQNDGKTDDLLVCIPLPGRNRYRMSMLVPQELARTGSGDAVAHGLESGRSPELRHIQPVLDRLAPERTVASNLRWASIFRISHRIVDRYGSGRVFVAGDAAHIHPPTGAQGMNTGIQDAYNLAWKLALTVRGVAASDLLDSYDAERRPVGEEVVRKTVRHARKGFEDDPDTPETILRREAQLLVGYRGSPLVGEDADGAGLDGEPRPGDRAPDARGLTRNAVSFPMRLFELARGPRHTLLLYADATTGADELRGFEQVASEAAEAAHGLLDAYAILAPEADARGLLVPVIRDSEGAFRKAYAAHGACAYLVRPDGYVGYRASPRRRRADRGPPATLVYELSRCRTVEPARGISRALPLDMA